MKPTHRPAHSLTHSRPSQDTPSDMVHRLLALIRGQFCADVPDKKWFSLQDWFRRKVILWPASFMYGHGFTLTPARYEEIMRAIFMDIKHHAGTVRDWNGYLLMCVQSHWQHHWEEYYAEAKSTRALADQAFLACTKVERQATVEPLAQAAAILTRRARQKRSPEPKQIPLL